MTVTNLAKEIEIICNKTIKKEFAKKDTYSFSFNDIVHYKRKKINEIYNKKLEETKLLSFFAINKPNGITTSNFKMVINNQKEEFVFEWFNKIQNLKFKEYEKIYNSNKELSFFPIRQALTKLYSL